METILGNIFQSNLRYRARWNTGLANHVSMAAAAMYLMKDKTNVSPEKILNDAAAYSMNLTEKRTNDSTINLVDIPWRIQKQLLGTDDLQESWEAYFVEEFQAEPELKIPKWLERLGLGFGAAAGHSIIRIYYAFATRELLTDSIYKAELAVAFSDLASRYLPMMDETTATGSTRLEDYLDSHPSTPSSVKSLVECGALIEDRMMVLRSLPYFYETAGNISIEFNLIDCLRKLASMATESPDFTLLHTLTAGQALFELLRWFPDMDNNNLKSGYRDFVVAAVIGSSLPNSKTTYEANTNPGELFKNVPDLSNDHSQKATFTLTKLYEEFEYPEFLNAARFYQQAYG